MSKEIWKEILGYENLYQVSNLGKIKNIKTNRILKLRPSHKGYLKTNLSKNGKLKTVFVHKLVAQTFILNHDNLPCINHKDENKLNNCVDNLEWCTYKYNSNYGTAIERRIVKTRKKVYKYSLKNKLIEIFNSTVEASKSVNGTVSGIVRCCNNQRKSYKGYIWKY